MTRMKELRKKKGFSQVRMQMLTGIDQSDYSKIETGKRNMSFEQCRRIADDRGVTLRIRDYIE